MDDAKIRQKYLELKSLDEQMRKVEKELSTVNSQLAEVEQIQKWIDEISKSSNSECFVPLTNGIFVKAKILDSDEFLMNVGSKVCVPKSKIDAIKLLDEQKVELENYRLQLSNQLSNLDLIAQKIEAEFLEHENSLQK
ncbi:prefoldin subunit alpha [Candidatus Woesearchaeota archaeon]|nr:prefoldin subunit alpha [Candidatus Woesearchaeota archaeon]